MQVSNGTGQGAEYRVGTYPGGNRLQDSSLQKFSTKMAQKFGTRGAEIEESRAEEDIREGRYETLGSIEDFVAKHVHKEVPQERMAEPAGYEGGMLEPGESQICSADESVYLEFWVNDKMTISVSFQRDPGHVMLVEKEGVFSLAVLSEKLGAA